MTHIDNRQRPDGLVDVARCLAEASELRRQSWSDPAVRRYGSIRMLAAAGVIAVAAAALPLLAQPAAVEVADARPMPAQAAHDPQAR